MKPRSSLQSPNPKAALYLRVSTGPQTEGTSLAGQLLACRQKAEQLGAEVVGVFEDVQSGADYSDRTALQNALSQIERGEADTLIIYDMTRYSRDLGHQQLIKKRVMGAGARLEFATFDVGDLNSAEAHLSFGVRGVFAEYERLNTRDRTMRGRVRRAHDGIQPQRAMRPFGYDLVTKRDVMERRFALEQLGHYVVRDDEARWVREMFERFARGESLNQVRKWLSLEGPPSPRKGTQWGAATVRRMLMHPIYKGEAVYGRLQRTTDESRLERGLNKVHYRTAPVSAHVSIAAPAIVSVELWQRCQTLLQNNQQLYSGRTQDRWLLTSLLRCPLCGSTMTPRKAKWTGTDEQYNQVFPEGQKPLGQVFEEGVSIGGMTFWAYRRLNYDYKCRRSVLVVDTTKRCPGVSAPVGPTETQVIEQVLEFACNPARVEEFLVGKARQGALENQDAALERERLQGNLLALQARERNVLALQERALENDLDPALYDEMLRSVVERRRATQIQLEQLQMRYQIASGVDARQKAHELSALLQKTEAVLLAPDELVAPHEKNRLLHLVLESVQLKPQEGTSTPRAVVVWKDL